MSELKSAEEWFLENQPVAWTENQRAHMIHAYKQGQLNAYKAGMTAAAEIADSQKLAPKFPSDLAFNDACRITYREILSARDRKESLWATDVNTVRIRMCVPNVGKKRISNL